jgi:hypothetical protein
VAESEEYARGDNIAYSVPVRYWEGMEKLALTD